MAAVLFVCLGNICRSPAAEGVFTAIVQRETSRVDASRFRIDSCGTGGGSASWYRKNGWSYHEGDSADRRMMREAAKRGYELTSRSRPLKKQDLMEFEHIICMEDMNRDAVLEAAEYWGGAALVELASSKITMMSSYCTRFTDATHIPDPWYEGGFDHVLDLLEDACMGLYNKIVEDL